MLVAKTARQILRGLRRRRPIDRGLRILAYHGVVERYRDARVEESFHLIADFRAQLAILKKCRVVAVDTIDDERAGGIVPRVAITFDDGFANNLIAAELLDEARLPAAFFIATGNVERQETIWPTLLRLALACGSARTLTLAGQTYDLDRDPDALAKVRASFKMLAGPERVARWTELLDQLRPGELGELAAQFPSIAMMSWHDVRSLATAGSTIGSHGCLHELQHAGQSQELRLQELTASKAAIEQETGRACDAFAFPNGTYHAGSADEVRATGYRRAFTMHSRAARATDDLLLLPRIVATGGADQLMTKLFFGN